MVAPRVNEFAVQADYFAEMVRQAVYERYQDDAYSAASGSTPRSARRTRTRPIGRVRRGVLEYDRRHGYRGAEGYVDLPKAEAGEEALEDALQDHPDSDDMLPAVVLEADAEAGEGLSAQAARLVAIAGERA